MSEKLTNFAPSNRGGHSCRAPRASLRSEELAPVLALLADVFLAGRLPVIEAPPSEALSSDVAI